MLTAVWDDLVNRREALVLGAAAALGAALLGVGSVVTPPVAVAAVAGLLFTAIALRNLAAGLAVFTLLTFFDRATTLTSAGLSPVKLAGVALALLWLVAVLDRGNETPLLLRDHPRYAAGVIVFVGWSFVSALWAPDDTLAVSSSFRLMMVAVFVFVLYSAVRETRNVRWLVWAFIGGTIAAQALGALNLYATDDGRLSGGFDDPNEFAAVIVPATAIAAFAFAAWRGRPSRWLLLPFGALLMKALLGTDSQAGLLALFVGLLVGIAFAGRVRKWAVAGTASLVLFGVVYYTFITPPTELTTITSQSNVGARESLWSVAADIVSDHPVIGTGAGNYVAVSPYYTVEDLDLPRFDAVLKPHIVHNTYLEVATELGFVGFLGFLALVTASITFGIRAVRRFERTGDWEMQLLARGVVVGTVAMLTASVFATATYEKQLWLLLGMGPALYSLALRRRLRVVGEDQG